VAGKFPRLGRFIQHVNCVIEDAENVCIVLIDVGHKNFGFLLSGIRILLVEPQLCPHQWTEKGLVSE
jgi:hypothetical protein